MVDSLGVKGLTVTKPGCVAVTQELKEQQHC